MRFRGTCVGYMSLPLQEGATLVAKSNMGCDPSQRRVMGVAGRGALPGCYYPGVHAACGCNERAALLLRSLGPVPVPENGGLGDKFLAGFASLRRIARRYRGHRWTYLETAESYEGALRRRYLEAERSLRVDGPVGPRDSYLRAFLKAEKLGVGKFAKPRMIFPRSPRYNLALASWLKPFEHWLWGYLTAKRFFGGSNTRIVAKGLNPRQRANLLVRKFSQFEDCVCFEVDGKAFEAHISRDQLVEEHRVYLAAYPGSKGLQRLLSRQLTLEGTTTAGWRFSRDGGRASGDYNTGMGNTLIMLCAVYSAMQGRGVPWDVLADGDNALVFVPARFAREVRETFADAVLRQCGHEMVLERPCSYLEAVRFGQSAPINLGPGLGWTMVRDPRKVLSGAFASHRWCHDPVAFKRWVAGVARCELSLAVGIPILQAWFLEVLKQTESVRMLRPDVYRDYFIMGGRIARVEDAREPTLTARLSFERAFGIPLGQQLWHEQLKPVLGFSAEPEEFHTLQDLWWARPGLLELAADS